VYFDRKEPPPPPSLKSLPKHWYQTTKLHGIKYQETYESGVYVLV